MDLLDDNSPMPSAGKAALISEHSIPGHRILIQYFLFLNPVTDDEPQPSANGDQGKIDGYICALIIPVGRRMTNGVE